MKGREQKEEKGKGKKGKKEKEEELIMKKNFLIGTLILGIMIALAGCGGGKKTETKLEDKQLEQPKQETATQELKKAESEQEKKKGKRGGAIEIGQEIDLENGKYIAVIEDVVFLNDYNDEPAVNIKYHVTNQSEEEKTILDMITISPRQDDSDMAITFLKTEDEDPNKVEDPFAPVPAGEKSGLDESAYKLKNNSDVVIHITTIADFFEGVEYTITVPVLQN